MFILSPQKVINGFCIYSNCHTDKKNLKLTHLFRKVMHVHSVFLKIPITLIQYLKCRLSYDLYIVKYNFVLNVFMTDFYKTI